MKSTPSSSITDGQQTKFNRLVEDITAHCRDLALKKVTTGSVGWQKVLSNGDELKAAVAEVFLAKVQVLAQTNEFADEETETSYTYPPEYKGPKPISEQVDILAKIFGLSLGFTSEYIEKVLPTLTLPEGAEGWFAIPRLDALASRFFAEITDPAERYCAAVRLVLEKIKASRKFYNYVDGQIDTKHIRMLARSLTMMERIARDQQGDILIIPANFGKRHAGRSVRRQRALVSETPTEFLLEPVSIGSMALTHPERYVRWEQLHTDCGGAEFAPDADGRFSGAPNLNFHDDEVKFYCDWTSSVDGRFGSPSGFGPQE